MFEVPVADRLLYATLTIFGALLLLWLQKLLSRLLPEPPKELAEMEAEVWRNTFTGEAWGDSDIDRLDMALTRAELQNPGATLRFNYDSLPAVISRQVGSLAASFIVVGWYLQFLPIGLGTVAILVVAVGALLHPYFSWMLSRPRR
jgi:hypothetical protein